MKTPETICPACPWRRASAPGWLGVDMDAADWASTAHSDDTVECHTRKGCHCRGLAVYRRNVCKMVRSPNPAGIEPDRELVFAGPQEFHRHHTRGEDLPDDWIVRRFTNDKNDS